MPCEMFQCEVCGEDFEREAAASFGPWRRDQPSTVCSLACAEDVEGATNH